MSGLQTIGASLNHGPAAWRPDHGGIRPRCVPRWSGCIEDDKGTSCRTRPKSEMSGAYCIRDEHVRTNLAPMFREAELRSFFDQTFPVSPA